MVQGRYEGDTASHKEEDKHGISPLGFDPSQALSIVTNAAKENPHAALAGAVGVGFLLGGGLTPRLLGAVAMFAARRYFQATVEETLASVQSTLEGRTTHHDA